MSQTFNCPNCGAPLDYQGSDPIIRCPYCASSVIVPENLRARPHFSSQPGNFTLSGIGDMGGLLSQARRLKEVKDLAEAGEMDKAVEIYRQVTGAEEVDARQAVGKLASGQPITLTSLSAADVLSQVKVVTAPGVHVQPMDEKTSRQVGRWAGCLAVIIVLSILLPLGIGLVAAFASLGAAGLSIPGLIGFGARDLSFGGEGSGPGQFQDVRAIGVNPVTGQIYAANYADGRVQVFDAEGKFVTQWIIPEENKAEPYFDDMAVARDGTIYIPVHGKIYRFDASGQPLGVIAHEQIGFDNLDIALDGSLVAIANGEDVVWLTAEGEIVRSLEAAISTVSDDSELDTKIAVDGLGNIYLLGTFNYGVFIFDSNGKFINRVGGKGDELGQFRAPYALEVDGRGRIYVSDYDGIEIFSNDGRFLDVIKVGSFAYGFALDDQGRLYITTNQQKINRYRIPEQE
jgi:DNA-directed RNA polymerase subunit RPC12/RpoP